MIDNLILKTPYNPTVESGILMSCHSADSHVRHSKEMIAALNCVLCWRDDIDHPIVLGVEHMHVNTQELCIVWRTATHRFFFQKSFEKAWAFITESRWIRHYTLGEDKSELVSISSKSLS